MHNYRLVARCLLVCALSAAAPSAWAQATSPGDKVPITTSSNEARQLFLEGRDLAEKLRATDSRKFYEQAIAKDKNFAMGYVGLANTSGTNKEFVDAVTRAASLAEKGPGHGQGQGG
jgi:hypothetical protein